MTNLWQDIRYGIRMLARNPCFTVVVVLILAIGIGANTSVFSVVNAVMLRPLPYKDAHRIVTLWERTKGGDSSGVSHGNFLFLREQNRIFEHLAGYQGRSLYVRGITRPREIRIMAVSSSLFPLLGVSPSLGRGFLPEEEQPGNDRVVVLSHNFWRDDFGGAPDALGKTISLTRWSLNPDGTTSLNREDYTIVGVMPPGFEFPFGRPTPFWVPLVLEKYGVRSLARLKKGVTLEQTRAAMAVITDQLRRMDPKANAERTVCVDRLLNRVLKGNRKLLLLLLGSAGFVLLIAASNVANLFLARATARQREMAMRIALGASRTRVLRQMLTESLVLSVGAGALGLLLTFLTVGGVVRLCPADVPRMQETGVDLSVLFFTLGASVLTGLLFGVIPAWRASDARVSQVLKEGWGRSGTGRGWRRLHGSLVVSQVGLSLILLIAAALLIRSLIALQRVDLGFLPAKVLTVCINLPEAKYPESYHCTAFFKPLLERIRALPHVRFAGLIGGDLDLSMAGETINISIPGRPSANPEEEPFARWAFVSPDFFEAMGIRLLRGRVFTDQDEGDGNLVIIDENLARKYFADTDPIGRKIKLDEFETTIVGVVSTTRDFQTLEPTHASLYQPLGGHRRLMVLVVRTDGDPMGLAAVVRMQVAELEKDQVITKAETLEATLAGMLAPRRFTMVLLSLFSGIALILASVGVYGLLQYSTTQQTHDLGIRMAIGARRVDVLRMVLLQGLRLTFIGVVIGLAGALALTRVLSSLLYDVTPTDPLTLAGVSLVLIAIALLASYIPARRAARINPMDALRYE